MNFLIILLAVIILEAYGELDFIQRDQWVTRWYQGLARLKFLARPASLTSVVFIIIPVFFVHLFVVVLSQNHLGLLAFIVDRIVLLYSLGRGNLDTQISLLSSDLKGDDLQAAFDDACVVNIGHREGASIRGDDLRDKMFAALPYRVFERSFAVVFWFFFFGAPAALCYRLLALHGDLDLEALRREVSQPDTDPKSQSLAAKMLWLSEWIPARLLGFIVGLVGSFSHSMAHLRQLIFSRDTQTADLLRRCVNGALGDVNGNELKAAELNKASINAVTSLFTRAMTAWLVGIAILVILS